ncbi:MAG: hypothetical protein HKN62_13995 [Phycisphaerales bacterium]|nr:hypothetical protein [Phycisphaerales bacterium]
MSFVYDLYGEVTSFFRLLREQLQASDLDVGKPLARRLSLPRSKAERGPVSFLMKTNLGLIAELSAASVDDIADEDEEIEDSEVEDLPASSKALQVTPDTQFVAVRALLFDPKRAKDTHFRPFVVAAALSSLIRTPVLPKKKALTLGVKPQDTFSISRRHLPHLLGSLNPNTVVGTQISCRIPRNQLSTSVVAVVTRDLAEFDSETSIESFVQELVSQVEAGQ